MFKMKKIIKKLKSEGSSRMAKMRGTVLCQATFVSIFQVSVNINLIMKLVNRL